MLAGRESSTAGVLLHTAIAESVGLSATDEKTIEILARLGPLSAGEIAQHTGLASASVTSLIDRLEERGLVRRVRDAVDRRRVMVEVAPEKSAELGAMFEPIRREMETLLAKYDDAQLAAIADYLSRAAAWSREHAAALRARRGR
ncbi:MarR family winged helix-turn-helix transcriptional regulator [Sandaracinus amylolyticus]|uniref:Transcriptional regulator, MarR family protein n=1 Tax=Sandaracinus amylolyticus TaxID=927083 RepID=A0A0F6YG71_9BACT|nr:MarR family transcriptional regulator [Sandaracinus amylolyticus]AKF03513.1 Transcriptional regulator, MarR family protein [Sandaracinus amylolyticus]